MFEPYEDGEEIERMKYERKMRQGGRKYSCPTCHDG